MLQQIGLGEDLARVSTEPTRLIHRDGRYARRRRVRTRQVQLMSWAASASLHLPDGPTARRRDADLPGLPERVAWIHAHDALLA